ncbi:hypothetical protein FB451DRAFT_1169852 [Mycena latifolia]|nr:hypothetical protein FB451DRAFT_1169852 [Mycena latifolia]
MTGTGKVGQRVGIVWLSIIGTSLTGRAWREPRDSRLQDGGQLGCISGVAKYDRALAESWRSNMGARETDAAQPGPPTVTMRYLLRLGSIGPAAARGSKTSKSLKLFKETTRMRLDLDADTCRIRSAVRELFRSPPAYHPIIITNFLQSDWRLFAAACILYVPYRLPSAPIHWLLNNAIWTEWHTGTLGGDSGHCRTGFDLRC